ncbi:MAG: hypothetical protein H6799_02965 [Candidatus Nomurabacteria bacterium]|nr:MAG: hypothetical protein H6799_02965 [Candidatus Nomurabacteria bacterium]
MKSLTKKYLIGLSILFGVLFIASCIYGYLYATSPSNIRNPKYEHYHMRTQIIVDDQAVDFTNKEFQESYDDTSCSAEIPAEPVDFHDGMGQMTHVHWKNLTGGQFLKYYGWNLTGGSDDVIGRRYDMGMMNMQTVKRHGNLLPSIPEDSNFYIYTGDADNYQKRDWNEFLNSNMEDFFSKESRITTSTESSNFSISDLFFKKAYAHGEAKQNSNMSPESTKTDEELSTINNLIGNVVIFVQKSEPTEQQIIDRFNNLVPLSESTCGG